MGTAIRRATVSLLLWGATSQAQDAAEALAKQNENPLASVLRISLRGSAAFDIEPGQRVAYGVALQPDVPIPLTQSTRLITTLSVPYRSDPVSLHGRRDGLSDLALAALLAPANPGSTSIGFGPLLIMPTSAEKALGSRRWAVGPDLVLVTVQGAFVLGVGANNVWSFAGDNTTPPVDRLSVTPFVNWNLGGGWALVSSPTASANWEVTNNRWGTLVGGGVTKTFDVGRDGMTVDVQAYKEVVLRNRNWSLRAGVTFVAP